MVVGMSGVVESRPIGCRQMPLGPGLPRLRRPSRGAQASCLAPRGRGAWPGAPT